MEQLLEKLNNDFRGEILCNEPLFAHTSWKLGGPADLFLVPQTCADLQQALREIHKRCLPWLVIGNGSNILVADAGFRGVVIQLERLNRINFLLGEKVEVEAGVQLAKLIKECVQHGLGGLEELSGIPGMIGGALLMNAGALDSEIGTVVSQIYLTDGHGEWALRRDQIDFSYRHSGLEGKGVISGAVLQLKKNDVAMLDLKVKKVLARRKGVQNVSGAHAGSVFKNFADIKAWELIDKAGMRGCRKGAAEVSAVHCNHIVNLGGAAAKDVMALIKDVQQAVATHTGHQLELEVRLVGWED